MDLNTVRDTRLLEVAPRFVSVLAAAVSVMDLAAFADGFGPPDCGIADRRAHFEDHPRVEQARVLIEEATDRRSDDRNVTLFRLALHLLEDGLALRQHGAEVILDAFICDWHCATSAQCLPRLHLKHFG